jgi:mannose-1-phosphate guanylyltransferase
MFSFNISIFWKEFEKFVKSSYEKSQKDVSESNQLFETLLEKYFERDPEDVDFMILKIMKPTKALS